MFFLLCAVVTIPPSEISAYNMPETKRIREPEIEGKYLTYDELGERSAVEQIRRILSKRPAENKAANPAFFVTGDDPLAEALAIFKGRRRRISFTPEDDLRLIYFAHPAIHDTAIDKVTVGKEIMVHYHFICKSTPMARWNLAIIPIGKLEAGDYRVRFVQGEPESDGAAREERPSRDAVRRIISGGFQFEVKPVKKRETK